MSKRAMSGPAMPRRGEAVREHSATVGFLHPPPERLDTMLEARAAQREALVGVHDPRGVHGAAVDRHELLARRGQAEAIEVLLTARRVVDRHGVVAFVEGPAHDHARQAEAVIAVEVGDADPGHGRGRHPGDRELSLRALPGIEQQALAVPSQQVAVVVAMPRRGLAGRPQHDEFALAHTTGLPADRPRRCIRHPERPGWSRSDSCRYPHRSPWGC